ncbi:MAG: hypothetical protein QME66_08340 [Candidatus Eisenbacteria bacterium]|nr:hypothetical protein [Candidatus Eisenbacteria bacterium]
MRITFQAIAVTPWSLGGFTLTEFHDKEGCALIVIQDNQGIGGFRILSPTRTVEQEEYGKITWMRS